MSDALTTMDSGFSRRWLPAALIVLTGLILGVAVGRAMWVVLAVFTALPLVLAWPVEAALGAFVIMVPFDSIAALNSGSSAPGRTLTWFVGVGAMAVLMGWGLVSRKLERPAGAARWWVLFVLWGSITYLWAINPQATLNRFPTAWSLLGFYLIAVSLRVDRRELSWVSTLAVLGGVAAGAYVVSQFYHGQVFREGMVNTRASLMLGQKQADPNFFAAGLLLPISLAIGMFLSHRKKIMKMMMLAAAALMTLAILLTMSRGALGALTVLALVYFYRLRPNWRLIAMCSVLLLLTAFLPEAFWQRVQPSSMSKLSGRRDIWTVGAVLVKHYGVFGAGLENFSAAYEPYAGYAPTFAGYNRDAHNVYLNICTELGILGLILFGTAAYIHLRDARRSQVSPDRASLLKILPYEAACCALLVHSLSVDLIWTKTFWLSWILLAIATRVMRAEESQPKPRVAVAPEMGPMTRSHVYGR